MLIVISSAPVYKFTRYKWLVEEKIEKNVLWGSSENSFGRWWEIQNTKGHLFSVSEGHFVILLNIVN